MSACGLPLLVRISFMNGPLETDKNSCLGQTAKLTTSEANFRAEQSCGGYFHSYFDYFQIIWWHINFVKEFICWKTPKLAQPKNFPPWLAGSDKYSRRARQKIFPRILKISGLPGRISFLPCQLENILPIRNVLTKMPPKILKISY